MGRGVNPEHAWSAENQLSVCTLKPPRQTSSAHPTEQPLSQAPSAPTDQHWPEFPRLSQAAMPPPPLPPRDILRTFLPFRLLISAPHHYLRLLISKGQAAVGHHGHRRASSLGHGANIPHWFDHKACFRMLSHALKCLNFSICSPSLSFYLSSSFRASTWLWYLQSHWISRGNSELGWGRDPWEPRAHRKVQLQERAACFFGVFVIPKFKSQRLNRAGKLTFSILLPNQNSKAS